MGALHHYMDAGHDWAEHHAAVMALVVGAMIAIVVAGIAPAAVELVRGSLAPPAGIESAPTYPVRELSREWRWERDAIHSDYVYRVNREAARDLEWIGQPGRRAR